MAMLLHIIHHTREEKNLLCHEKDHDSGNSNSDYINDRGVDVLCVWYLLFLRLLIINIRAPGRLIISSQFHKNITAFWKRNNIKVHFNFVFFMQNILPDVSVCGIACLLTAHCQKRTWRRNVFFVTHFETHKFSS